MRLLLIVAGACIVPVVLLKLLLAFSFLYDPETTSVFISELDVRQLLRVAMISAGTGLAAVVLSIIIDLASNPPRRKRLAVLKALREG